MPPVLSRAAHRVLDVIESRWGLAILLAAMLPLLLWRGSLETLWNDELYSVRIAELSLRRIIDHTSRENHPPGYYALLREWLELGGSLGIGRRPWWGRLLSVLAWTAGVSGAWVLLRRLVGAEAGTLLTWALALNGQWLHFARNMRGYVFVGPMMLIQFLLLVMLWQRARESRGSAGGDAALWSAYALLAGGAMYFHLLAGFLNLAIGLVWLAMAAKCGVRTRFAWMGTLAHAAAIALFSPWLVRVAGQHAYLMADSRAWYLPPSWDNVLAVFSLWLPGGEVGLPIEHPALAVLGLFALAIPIALGVMARKAHTPVEGPLPTLAVVGVAVAVLFVGLLVFCQLTDLARVFHPPRYPAPAAAIFAVGVVAAVIWQLRRLGHAARAAWLFAAPWLLMGVLGQGGNFAKELRGGVGLARWQSTFANIFPEPGERLYVSPVFYSEWFRESLKDCEVHPISGIASHPADAERALLLVPNVWIDLQSAEEKIPIALIEAGRLSAWHHRVRLPSNDYHEMEVYYMKEVDREAAAALFGDGIPEPTNREVPANAVSLATPEGQFLTDGWDMPAARGDGAVTRLGLGPRQVFRFDQRLGRGRHRFELHAWRNPHPTEEITVTVRIGDRAPVEKRLGPGGTYLSEEFTLDEEWKRPVVTIDAPAWTPADHIEGALDTREMTYQLNVAWFLKVE